MDNYQSIIKSMLALSLKKHYRMSDRQITLLEWNQVIGGTIKMRGTGREVHLTPEEQAALRTIPIHGTSSLALPLLNLLKPQKNRSAKELRRNSPKCQKLNYQSSGKGAFKIK